MFKFGSQNKMFLELQGKYSVGALSETTEADRVLFKTKNTQQKHSTYTVSAPIRVSGSPKIPYWFEKTTMCGRACASASNGLRLKRTSYSEDIGFK